jgi:hypothetical protein
MILVALVLGVFMVGKQKQPAFGFVLAWAFWGIYSAQSPESRMIGLTAGPAWAFIFSLTVTILIKSKTKSLPG